MPPALSFRRTVFGGKTVPDDYLVIMDRRVIGRILCTSRADGIADWTWSLYVVPQTGHDRGHAATLDEAKAAFRARVEAIWPFDPATMT